MRSKHFIALTTFFACFAFSALFAGLFIERESVSPELYEIVTVNSHSSCSTRKQILAVLYQDEENGEKRRVGELSISHHESLTALLVRAKFVFEYAKKSESINTEGLPEDFQTAWRKHMRAWADYSDFLDKAALAEIQGSELGELEKQYERDINSSWYEVLSVARSYGVHFSE